MNDLWTPGGMVHLAPSAGGRNVETGGAISIHTFRFHSAKHGVTREIKIPVDASMSQAQVEDMAANALEHWLTELDERAQRKVGKHTPSLEERKQVGAALREFRAHLAKRRESTNERLYYAGVKG
jgi:hypothetical protein